MKINIQTKGFDLTDGIKSHTEKRIHFSMSRMKTHITGIDLYLSDINGPKGGVDKQCKISIHCSNIASIIIRDTKADMYEAIDQAINRASNSLTRKISRVQKLSRINRRVVVVENTESIDDYQTVEEQYQY